jgi:hypothetical protein
MVKHIVSWKLKDTAEGRDKAANILYMKELLLSLQEKIRYMKSIEVGINSIHADASNSDIILITTHKSFNDLEAYQKHPEHVKVAEIIGKLRESRSCIDFEF